MCQTVLGCRYSHIRQIRLLFSRHLSRSGNYKAGGRERSGQVSNASEKLMIMRDWI